MSSERLKDTAVLESGFVILGGGGAGLAAAVAAAEQDVQVILLEKLGSIGGNTRMSSGMFAAESPAQKRQLIEARKDVFFKITMDFAHWKTNPRIVRDFIDRSADTIRWLESKGLFFDCFPMFPNQIATWHQARPVKYNGRGAEVVQVLADRARELGVRIYTHTRAKKILLDANGAVEGVIAERFGNERRILSRNVLVATGGYGGNKELLKKYAPYYRENMLCDGYPHMGDGLIMAMEAGAANEGLGLLLMSGPQIPNAITLQIEDPPNTVVPLMALTLEPNTLWVNKHGQRFTDETIGFNHYVSANTVNRQPDNICYTIIDRGIVRTMAEEGMVMGLGRTRIQQRTKLPGLEAELRKQTEGWMLAETVDFEKCNGCGICAASCPAGSIELDTIAADRGEYSACRAACPAGVDMRTYMHLLKYGKLEEAYSVLREYLPLPAVTGRVCPHLCETDCARSEVDEAVNINALERFLADYWLEEKAERAARKFDSSVAVIGSGPAGLSCAYFLTKMGYAVTVFEAMKVLGGMLRTGIPRYRLPEEILNRQIDYIRDMGVEFKPGIAVGKELTFEKLRKDYQAVFFAAGNQLSKKIELEGSELEGVLWGLDFLRGVNLGEKIRVKENVAVIGGGNVAIDVALTALRLGAKNVQLACLETGEDIPAFKEELDQAIREGVGINEGWGPARILGKGKNVTGIELVRCTNVFDSAGCFNPCFDRDNTKTLQAGTVILAIGQSPDLSLAPGNMETTGSGTVKADPVTLETNITGFFAGGDVIGGTASVVKAIADGRNAAVSIDRYLRGEDMRNGRDIKPKVVQNPPKDGIPVTARMQTNLNPVKHAAVGMEEIRAGFGEDSAREEVQRCMTCGSRPIIHITDDCRMCKTCEINCPTHAISAAQIKRIEPHVKMSDSLDEIAAWIGAKPETLKATIDEYNAACDSGYDPVFAKDRKYLVPLRTPPYFAIRANSDYLDTIGGLKVNEHMEVLNKQDNPIPGLYAAGVIVGGWEMDTYCVILSGAASGFAVNSGRIAAESVISKHNIIKSINR